VHFMLVHAFNNKNYIIWTNIFPHPKFIRLRRSHHVLPLLFYDGKICGSHSWSKTLSLYRSTDSINIIQQLSFSIYWSFFNDVLVGNYCNRQEQKVSLVFKIILKTNLQMGLKVVCPKTPTD
jgi:hypothetical protein